MTRTWKCLSGTGYIWTIKSDIDKGTITIIDHNEKIVFKEENVSEDIIKIIERSYINIKDIENHEKDVMYQ